MSNLDLSIAVCISIIALVLASITYLKSVIIKGLQNKYINRPLIKADSSKEDVDANNDTVTLTKRWTTIYSVSMLILSLIPPALLIYIIQHKEFLDKDLIFQIIIWALFVISIGLFVSLFKYEKSKWGKSFEKKFDAVIENKKLKSMSELKELLEGINIAMHAASEKKYIEVVIKKDSDEKYVKKIVIRDDIP